MVKIGISGIASFHFLFFMMKHGTYFTLWNEFCEY